MTWIFIGISYQEFRFKFQFDEMPEFKAREGPVEGEFLLLSATSNHACTEGRGAEEYDGYPKEGEVHGSVEEDMERWRRLNMYRPWDEKYTRKAWNREKNIKTRQGRGGGTILKCWDTFLSESKQGRGY